MPTSAPVPATEGLPTEPHPLRSVHSSNFAEILAHIGASLLGTTNQVERLVILRNDGGVLNTHFRLFPKPMGLAIAPTSWPSERPWRSGNITMSPLFHNDWIHRASTMSASCRAHRMRPARADS